MAGQPPDVGPAWDERASLPPLAAVLDPQGGHRKNELLSRIQLRAVTAALGDVAGRRVLDFGAGTGRLCRALVERGAWVVGLDASEEMARVGTAEVPEARYLVTESAECLRPASFDAVTTVMVLQYFSPPVELGRIVQDLARLLIPGGRLVLLEQVRDSGLARGASLDEYRTAIEGAGLRISAVKRVRRSDSRMLGPTIRHPGLDRWLSLTSSLEARVDPRPLTGGRYADVVFVAESPVS